MSAQRLYDLGAINQVVSNGQALKEALALAHLMAAKPPAAIAGLKQILAVNDDATLNEALRHEQAVFQSVVVTEEAREGMEQTQSQYDAGRSIAEVNNYDDWNNR